MDEHRHPEPRDATGLSDELSRVTRYHQETKHHFFRYARALGYLDWANQPDPFRRYHGAPLIPLPILTPDDQPGAPPYDALYRPGAISSVPVSIRSLSRLCEHALALTAWKQAGGTRWALRSNPSSGNLHPTEGYLFIGALEGLAPTPGLYHYAPKEHALELRATCPPERYAALMSRFPAHAFLVALSSIHWREAWKYGERAFRYCQHDVGHAIGSIRYAAATLGWKMLLLDGVADETVAELIGVNRLEDVAGAEREHPDCVAVLWPCPPDDLDPAARTLPLPLFLDLPLVREVTGYSWYGRANRLSSGDPVPWELIDEVSGATWKTQTDHHVVNFEVGWPETEAPTIAERSSLYPDPLSAGQVIRQRRSAVAFDGKTSVSSACFFAMLERVMPRSERQLDRRPTPWDALPWDPAIHLAIFIHRVEGLAQGLYLLARDPAKTELLRSAMLPSFAWTGPLGSPPDLPLFLLQEGDARELAVQVSCHQDIAGDGAFSLGMIAEFNAPLNLHGPWFYRRLFWEAGLIGQVLYLEAEAFGVRATGIGCFFDDPVHQALGVADTTVQSLYHFTVGGPVDDPRLTTWPPYGS